jgi:hypothetical protein
VTNFKGELSDSQWNSAEQDMAASILDLKKLAKATFETHDYEAAYPLYRQLTERYEEVGDDKSTFFMSSWAIRCLEELVANPDYTAKYLNEAQSFLALFADKAGEAIYARIKWNYHLMDIETNSMQRQEVVTRHLISELNRYLQHCPHMKSIERLIVSLNLDLLEIKLTTAEGATAKELAEEFFRFAASCADRSSTSEAQAEPFRLLYVSYAHKFLAFAAVLSPSLSRAFHEMRQSFAFARRSLYLAAAEFRKRAQIHLCYVRYWQSVLGERLCLVKAMENGANSRLCLKSARRYWRIASQVAGTFSERDLFPNRFYSRDDLNAEIYFIEACERAFNGQFADAAESLGVLLRSIASKHEYTWRYDNIQVRYALFKTLSCILGRLELDRSIIGEAKVLTSAEPLGSAARAIVTHLQLAAALALTNNSPADLLLKAVWEPVRRLVPLDAFPTEIEIAADESRGRIEPMRGLPTVLAYGLRERPEVGLSREASFRLWQQEIAPALRAYFLLLLDYQCQANKSEGIELNSSSTLIHLTGQASALSGLLRDQHRASYDSGLETLSHAISEEEREAEASIDWVQLFSDLRRLVILPSLRLFPCIVRVHDRARIGVYDLFNCLVPDPFSLSKKRTSITLYAKRSELESAPKLRQVYYLPPKWRVGTRFSYRIDLPEKKLLCCSISFDALSAHILDVLNGRISLRSRFVDVLRGRDPVASAYMSRTFEERVADWIRQDFGLSTIQVGFRLPLPTGPGDEVDVYGEIRSRYEGKPLLVVICECKLCISEESTVSEEKANQLLKRVNAAEDAWPGTKIRGLLISNGDFDPLALQKVGEHSECVALRAKLPRNWRNTADWRILDVNTAMPLAIPSPASITANGNSVPYRFL